MDFVAWKKLLISKAVNNFGFLFPPLVFNISDLLWGLSFDAFVFVLLLPRSNVILSNAAGISLAIKKVLNLHLINSHQF